MIKKSNIIFFTLNSVINNLLTYLFIFQAKEFHETLKVNVCIETIFTYKIK